MASSEGASSAGPVQQSRSHEPEHPRDVYEKVLVALIGIGAGAFGYWINVFWMQPILRYRDLRLKVFADFIFYAQVVNAEGLNERMRQLYDERVFSNRQSAADLAACITQLPTLYQCYVRRRKQNPAKAVSELIGYSNTTDWDVADQRRKAIMSALGLPPDSEAR